LFPFCNLCIQCCQCLWIVRSRDVKLQLIRELMLSATRELYLRQLNTVTYPNSLVEHYNLNKRSRKPKRAIKNGQSRTSPDICDCNCIPNLYDTCCAIRCLKQGSSRFLGGVRVAHNYGFLSCLFVFVCLRSVTCASNVASVSGLSILYCPLRFSGTFI
jgi:hypothetical protein